MIMRAYLGIDLGTSSLKALVVARDGTVLGRASADYPLGTPRPGWVEQDPELWWQAAVTASRSALAAAGRVEVAAVGCAGQMHGAIFLGARKELLRPAIIWADTRTVPQCAEISQRIPADFLIPHTGSAVNTGFTAPKVLWVREYEPEIYQRLHHLLLPKDELRRRLTDEVRAEPTDGSATLLFDLGRRQWSGEICRRLDIDPAILPPLVDSSDVAGHLTGRVAEALGLPAGLPVAAGAGDQAAGALGSGVLKPGQVLVAVGSGGQITAPVSGVPVDLHGRVHTFCHCPPDRWHLMGAIQSAGLALTWLRRTLGEIPLDTLLQEATVIPAGADGLVFLPYLSGERTPHLDPEARGVFVGLALHHTRGHLVRAVLEGVAMAMRDAMDVLRELGVSAPEALVAGGGTRPLWRQIMADALNLSLRPLGGVDATARGAAILAAVAAGDFPDLESAAAALVPSSGEPTVPTTDYSQILAHFRRLYLALRDHFTS